MKAVRLLISGRVQGVSFRAFIKEQADKLEVNGYVRNLDDGKVEVVIEGEKVEGMIKICKKGSPLSKVENIEVEKVENKDFKDFKIVI
jgi:acylphosphatase